MIAGEFAEQEAHRLLLIKMPAHGTMIGQDLFYNNIFLLASQCNHNKNRQMEFESMLQKDLSKDQTEIQ